MLEPGEAICRATPPCMRRFRKAGSAQAASQAPLDYTLRELPRTCFEGPFGDIFRASSPPVGAESKCFPTTPRANEIMFNCRRLNL